VTTRARAHPRRAYAIGAALLAAIAVGLFLVSGGGAAAPVVIDVAGGPAGIAVADGRVWVAGSRSGAITMLDAEKATPIGEALRPGGAPTRLAVGEAGVWIADAAAGAVIPMQLRPPRTFASLQPGADASDVALAGGAVWIASSADGRVYVSEPGVETARPLPTGVKPVALAADERRVLAVGGDTLTAFDARRRTPAGSPVRVGGALVDVALAGETAWVADATGGRIVAVEGGAVTGSIAVGRRPVALATAGDDVYVLAEGNLVRVRDGEVRSRRPVGAEATALAVDSGHVWVSSPNTDEVLRFER
jgi:DNA-binding beta-propeller fold protein YncE